MPGTSSIANMTTDTSGPTNPEPAPQPDKGPRVRRLFERARTAAVDAGRASAPVLKSSGGRVSDWLARVGWGKFFLVALLMLAFAGILSSILTNDERAIVVGPDRVQVDIRVADDGVHIQAPATAPGAPPATPKPPKPPRAPGSKPPAGMSIDDKGIRIFADKDGEKVAIVVDDKGVRVERAPEDAPPVAAGDVIVEGDGRSIHIPADVARDPERFAEALDHARDQVEAIVQDQIGRQVAREVRRYRGKGNADWLVGFVMLLIMTGIIVKVVLGGKKRAERRAQVATATAAEEGLKRQLAEAQLKMMQAQVEPHFLFNTLASVDYLIETDPTTASKMQKNLIQYLRAALPQMREGSTTLGKEVQLCRAFLEILRFRMEDRLQYTVIVPQGLQSAQFPPMMLQSLVENSIKHGLEPKPEGGSLSISADIANGKLRVTVADTGLGFAVAGQQGTGVGLANVRERLAALYGGAARLSIEANSPAGTIVTIEVPYTYESDAPTADAVPQPA